MHCQQLVIATVAVLAWAVSAAPGPLPEEMVHGGFMEHEGQMYRYHQLARDVFTTVPVDEFDEKRHMRSDEIWDMSTLVTGGDTDDDSFNETFSLEERNIANSCKAGWSCAKEYGRASLEFGWYMWLAAAQKADSTGAKKGLVAFLKTPFFANAGGVAIAGLISNSILNHGKPADCSTANSEADVVSAALAAAIKANPKATQITADITGPKGEWHITLGATPAGQTPKATCG